ncbi:hypothetical protein ACFLYA_00560 [Candidatus Dependentiae bacterium]
MIIKRKILILGLSALFLAHTPSQCLFGKNPTRDKKTSKKTKIVLNKGGNILSKVGGLVSGSVLAASLAGLALLWSITSNDITVQGGLMLVKIYFSIPLIGAAIISSGMLASSVLFAKIFKTRAKQAEQDLKKSRSKRTTRTKRPGEFPSSFL